MLGLSTCRMMMLVLHGFIWIWGSLTRLTGKKCWKAKHQEEPQYGLSCQQM